MSYLLKNFNEVSQTKMFEELEYHPALLMEVTKLAFSNVNSKEIG
jgi:hypothetical protein